MSELKF